MSFRVSVGFKEFTGFFSKPRHWISKSWLSLIAVKVFIAILSSIVKTSPWKVQFHFVYSVMFWLWYLNSKNRGRLYNGQKMRIGRIYATVLMLCLIRKNGVHIAMYLKTTNHNLQKNLRFDQPFNLTTLFWWPCDGSDNNDDTDDTDVSK